MRLNRAIGVEAPVPVMVCFADGSTVTVDPNLSKPLLHPVAEVFSVRH